MLGPNGELVVTGGQEPLDRCGAEDTVELRVKSLRGVAQRHLLLDRQVSEIRHEAAAFVRTSGKTEGREGRSQHISIGVDIRVDAFADFRDGDGERLAGRDRHRIGDRPVQPAGVRIKFFVRGSQTVTIIRPERRLGE